MFYGKVFIIHFISSGAYVGDELPSPSLEEDDEGVMKGRESVPVTRQQTVLPSSTSLRKTGRATLLSGSECDRPDSGFDSKDDQEEDGGKGDAAGSDGSPELGEISRQALARQPIKKKRVFHHNII